jgi:hypothetical protein
VGQASKVKDFSAALQYLRVRMMKESFFHSLVTMAVRLRRRWLETLGVPA